MSNDIDELTIWDRIFVGLYLTGIAIGLIALATAITIEDWWNKYVGRHFQRNNMPTVRSSNTGSLRHRCMQKVQGGSQTTGEKRIRE